MRVSLFSQSLFALPLEKSFEAAARNGYTAIELACTAPHFTENRVNEAETLAGRVRDAGLEVAALSLFTEFTNPDTVDREVASARAFLRTAPVFGTNTVKASPGKPASADAQPVHWDTLRRALDALAPAAADAGTRLAFETHMRHVTDTAAGTRHFLELAPPEVGLTIDFSNLTFAGDRPEDYLDGFLPRTFHVHVKNGYIDEGGGWVFTPLDEGWTDYSGILPALEAGDYDGYLSIECLGQDAAEQPEETIRRDREILASWLETR